MKTIVLSNMKGGVGKSVSAVGLASGLHNQGKRVLLCDMDPQSNAAFMAGINVLDTETTLFDVFKGDADIEDAIQPVKLAFDVAMCGLQATAADLVFNQMGRERILSEALKPVRNIYDFVICDTSPSLSLLTTASATAADYLIAPLTADPLAIQGAEQLDGFTRNVRKYCNPDLQIMGLLLTMYNGRSTLTRSIEGIIQQTATKMGTTVFNTRIRRAQALQDAVVTQQDFYTAAARSTATADYMEFVTEVLNRIEGKD